MDVDSHHFITTLKLSTCFERVGFHKLGNYYSRDKIRKGEIVWGERRLNLSGTTFYKKIDETQRF